MCQLSKYFTCSTILYTSIKKLLLSPFYRENEEKKGEVTCLRSYSQKIADLEC